MLKLCNIYKEYSTNSEKNIVLKNCSYEFNKNGLYFITGASGSGKTTLLNLIAGFDQPTSGNIYFKNKKLENFSYIDLNNYWSHNVSFVFQEFNLIESLNVEDNLVISLRLIGIAKEPNEINDILKLLGIENLKKRKINELSGGQKQRVAIARALLREVDILICDEPTGLLDFKNSNIIFSYLKKISKNKLVIVVSHNIELANKYGDKVLEVQNGALSLISDFSSVLDKKLTIEKQLKEQIENSSYGFEKITYKKELIKIAFNYLFKKKIRLLISLFFTIFSFLVFSASSCFFSFNSNESILYSMDLNDEKFITIKKQMEFNHDSNDFSFNYVKDVNSSQNDIVYVQNQLNDNVLAVYAYFQTNMFVAKKNNNEHVNIRIEGFSEIDYNTLESYGFELFGILPEKNNEVVITKFMFDFFKIYGFFSGDNLYEIEKYEDIVGKKIKFNLLEYYPKEFEFTITGIIDTHFNPIYYSQLFIENNNEIVEEQLHALLKNSIHNVIFLKKNFYIDNIKNLHNELLTNSNMITINDNTNEYLGIANGISCKLPDNNNKTIYLEDKQSKQADGDITIPLSSLNVSPSDCRMNYIEEFCESVYDSIKEKFETDNPYAKNYKDYVNYLIKNDFTDLIYFNITKSDFTNMSIKKYIEYIIPNSIINITIRYDSFEENYSLNLKGVYYSENTEDTIVYVNDIFLKKLVEELSYLTNDIIFFAIPLYGEQHRNLSNIEKMSQEYESDIKYSIDGDRVISTYFQISNDYSYSYNQIENSVSFYRFILILVGITSLVFSIIFLMIYTNGTIEDRKKELGILKILGIKNNSLYLIFFYINLIFSLICTMSMLISFPFLESFMNSYLCAGYSNILHKYIDLSIFEYMLAIFSPILLTLLGSFIPINRILRKPILEFLQKNK